MPTIEEAQRLVRALDFGTRERAVTFSGRSPCLYHPAVVSLGLTACAVMAFVGYFSAQRGDYDLFFSALGLAAPIVLGAMIAIEKAIDADDEAGVAEALAELEAEERARASA